MAHSLLPAGWRLAQTPKKTDYKSRALLLLQDSPNQVSWINDSPSPFKAGFVVYIERRLTLWDARVGSCIYPRKLLENAPDNTRMLRVSYEIPGFNVTREEILPESWIDESKLIFIEKDQ